MALFYHVSRHWAQSFGSGRIRYSEIHLLPLKSLYH